MDDNGGRSDGAAEVTCSLSNAVDSVCPSRYAKLVLFDCASPKTQISSLPCLSVEQEQVFFSPSLVYKDGRNASVLDQRSGFVVSFEFCKACALRLQIYSQANIRCLDFRENQNNPLQA